MGNMAGFRGAMATAEPDAIPGGPHDLAVLACAPEQVGEAGAGLRRAGRFFGGGGLARGRWGGRGGGGGGGGGRERWFA